MKYVLVVLLSLLSACQMAQNAVSNTISEQMPQTSAPGTPPRPASAHCELVNGSNAGCTGVAPVTTAPAPATQPVQPINPETSRRAQMHLDCFRQFGSNGSAPGQLVPGTRETVANYCYRQAFGFGQNAAPTPTVSAPRAVAPTSGFQGCVWRGRAYQPCDRIGNDLGQGFLNTTEIMINGRTFQSITGRAGPMELCECQRSIREWGCV